MQIAQHAAPPFVALLQSDASTPAGTLAGRLHFAAWQVGKLDVKSWLLWQVNVVGVPAYPLEQLTEQIPPVFTLLQFD